MLMTQMFYKKLRDVAIRYEYETGTDNSNILRDLTTQDLQLVGKTIHEIFNIPLGLPPNVKIDIKLLLSQSNLFCKK